MGLGSGTKLIAMLGVVLLYASLLPAQTTRSTSSASSTSSVPQGKYEGQSISAHDASGASRSPSTQPALTVASPALDMGRVALALAIVLGLIFTMRWAGKRFFPSAGVPRANNVMKVLSRLVISPKQQLLMIQVGRRIVVVGDAGGQMSPLSEITDPDEASSLIAQLAQERTTSSMKGFGALFNRAETNFEEKTEQAEEKSLVSDSPIVPDPIIDQTKGEIDDLADKIRLLSAQFNGK